MVSVSHGSVSEKSPISSVFLGLSFSISCQFFSLIHVYSRTLMNHPVLPYSIGLFPVNFNTIPFFVFLCSSLLFCHNITFLYILMPLTTFEFQLPFIFSSFKTPTSTSSHSCSSFITFQTFCNRVLLIDN
jgi:hypothetical protein